MPGLLERLRRPRPITTSAAPRLAPGVDAAPSPRRPEPSESPSPAPRLVPAGACTQLSAPAAHWSMPPSPPGYRPGVCHHPGHVVLDGVRFGVTPSGADRVPSRAGLTRCHHSNPDGC